MLSEFSKKQGRKDVTHVLVEDDIKEALDYLILVERAKRGTSKYHKPDLITDLLRKAYPDFFDKKGKIKPMKKIIEIYDI